eukprot:1375545-Rhodomonas_salina.6
MSGQHRARLRAIEGTVPGRIHGLVQAQGVPPGSGITKIRTEHHGTIGGILPPAETLLSCPLHPPPGYHLQTQTCLAKQAKSVSTCEMILCAHYAMSSSDSAICTPLRHRLSSSPPLPSPRNLFKRFVVLDSYFHKLGMLCRCYYPMRRKILPVQTAAVD